jgi:hypothetical protein
MPMLEDEDVIIDELHVLAFYDSNKDGSRE